MAQIISKDGKVKCVAEIPYPPEIIKSMKQAGYTITTKQTKKSGN